MTFRRDHSTRKWVTEVLLQGILNSYPQSKIASREEIERDRVLGQLRLSQKRAQRSPGLLNPSIFICCLPSKNDLLILHEHKFLFIFCICFQSFHSFTSLEPHFWPACVLIKSLCLRIIWIPAILYELRPDSSIMHEAAALAPVLRNAKRMSFKWLARCQREMESKFSKYQPTSQQKFTSV